MVGSNPPILLPLCYFIFHHIVDGFQKAPNPNHSLNRLPFLFFLSSLKIFLSRAAIRYQLAEALYKAQDECLDKYPMLYWSDYDQKACIIISTKE